MREPTPTFEHRLLLDGRWRDAAGGGRWTLIDPGRGEPVAEVPYARGEHAGADALAAVDAAQRAFATWSRLSPYQRGEVLERAAAWIRARARTCSHDAPPRRRASRSRRRRPSGSRPATT